MHASSPDGFPPHANSRFATTRWSVVLAAAVNESTPDSSEALASLCSAYWYPLYAFIRRKGNSAESAQDLTQSFFACLLEKKVLQQVDRQRGRFRSFLLASVQHFLADEHDRARAQKRGGGRTIVSMDALRDAEGRYIQEPARGLTPEQIFERRWALILLDQVLSCLRTDYERSGKQAVFERLKGYLMADVSQIATDSYANAAEELKMSPGAVKVAVYRLKQRYAILLRDEIAATVETEEEIDDEIRCLFEALG